MNVFLSDIVNRKEYDSFARHLNEKYSDYKKGKYLLPIDDEFYNKIKSLVKKSNQSDFDKHLEFVKFIRDLYNHKFVKNLISYSEISDIEYCRWIGEHREELDYYIADQITKQSKTFYKTYFETISFYGAEEWEDWGWTAKGVVIKFLKISRNEKNEYTVEPIEWETILTGLKEFLNFLDHSQYKIRRDADLDGLGGLSGIPWR